VMRTRGSTTAYSRSTTRFAKMMSRRVSSVMPVISGRSDFVIESTPGHPCRAG
jgi:hypothetical protein